MGVPHTFSLRRSLNSWVSSWIDFWMLGAFLGGAALLFNGCMSSMEKDASWSLPAQQYTQQVRGSQETWSVGQIEHTTASCGSISDEPHSNPMPTRMGALLYRACLLSASSHRTWFCAFGCEFRYAADLLQIACLGSAPSELRLLARCLSRFQAAAVIHTLLAPMIQSRDCLMCTWATKTAAGC